MSVEYRIFMTKLRDTIAQGVFNKLVELAVTQTIDDYKPEECASDAFEYAEAWIAERERRYGPTDPRTSKEGSKDSRGSN